MRLGIVPIIPAVFEHPGLSEGSTPVRRDKGLLPVGKIRALLRGIPQRIVFVTGGDSPFRDLGQGEQPGVGIRRQRVPA